MSATSGPEIYPPACPGSKDKVPQPVSLISAENIVQIEPDIAYERKETTIFTIPARHSVW